MEQPTKFSDRLIETMMKFINLKGVVALKDGILFILPLTIVGSVFLLLAQIPAPGFNTWVVSILGENWTDPLWQVFNGTFSIMGLVACFGIAYSYTKNEGHEPATAGVLAVVSFIITINSYVTTDKGVKVAGVISKDWTGGKGMITAIIIGLLVGATYSWFMKKKIVIKMPDGVPQGVANQFSALIPAAFIITCSMLVYIFFKLTMNKTFIEWIYEVLQIPLQGLTDSLPGVLVISIAIPLFWWFGVHGQSIVNGVITSLLTANALANQEILTKTGALAISNGAHIVTQQFADNFLILSGSGITFGLVIAMLFFGKSAQSKSLGKMAILPTIFNINEPVTFGFPIVLNPFMFIPFIGVPVIASLMVYASIATGLVHPFSGVMVPWSTPAIISGFIVGGWRAAVLQVAILAMSVVVYLPFFKKQDAINFKNEQELHEQHVRESELINN